MNQSRVRYVVKSKFNFEKFISILILFNKANSFFLHHSNWYPLPANLTDSTELSIHYPILLAIFISLNCKIRINGQCKNWKCFHKCSDTNLQICDCKYRKISILEMTQILPKLQQAFTPNNADFAGSHFLSEQIVLLRPILHHQHCLTLFSLIFSRQFDVHSENADLFVYNPNQTKRWVRSRLEFQFGHPN